VACEAISRDYGASERNYRRYTEAPAALPTEPLPQLESPTLVSRALRVLGTRRPSLPPAGWKVVGVRPAGVPISERLRRFNEQPGSNPKPVTDAVARRGVRVTRSVWGNWLGCSPLRELCPHLFPMNWALLMARFGCNSYRRTILSASRPQTVSRQR
jgi:hypothetical protein